LSDKSRRAEALDLLAELTDARAVASIERVFLGKREDEQQTAVQLLAQIDSPPATRNLAELSVKGTTERVRTAAARKLRGRERRDYAGEMVDLIRAPMRYQVQPVQGPGASGALLVETPRFKVLRTYDAPPPFQLSNQFYGYVGYDANGLPVVARGRELDRMAREGPQARAMDLVQIEARTAELLAMAQLKASVAQDRLIADIGDIETSNAQAVALNRQVQYVLTEALDAPDLKDDENGWHAWWYDQLGYAYEPPAQVEVVQNAVIQSAGPTIRSCFVAGTPVRTIDGRRPIDSLRVGDQVLCQDAATGSLSVQPVLVVYHNSPGRTLRVALDTGETIVPSIYHRFWRAGQGWAQARELKSGDVVRTLGGRARVTAVEPGATEPVFNLDVASGHTFFVGQSDALVHDNTLPQAHLRPFDAEPPLGATAAAGTTGPDSSMAR
ncbi:MAG: polymorphic toxin-type HINT domain-containing protein, partial [Isosphaeraceae bacterium]|nr:polymorphic toxin-type HINT domain-containing protein [Isosphaeraceae bacterium]